MPIYKYVTAQTAIRILCSHTIRLTQPSAFNDPFEFLPQFIRRGEELHRIDCVFRFDLQAERRKGIEKKDASSWDAKTSDIAARELLAELDKQIGVLCLTRNPQNLLMWAHYSDEHKGAVIEFDEKHPFFSGVIPVLYRKKRPIYAFSDFQDRTAPIADLCVKSKIWEYEKEVRIVKQLKDACIVRDKESQNPKYLFSLPPESIKGVTLGARMPVEQKHEIWKLIRHTEISIDIAQIANWEYALRSAPFKLRGKDTDYPVISTDTTDIILHKAYA